MSSIVENEALAPDDAASANGTTVSEYDGFADEAGNFPAIVENSDNVELPSFDEEAAFAALVPAEQRIANLFCSMPGRRDTFLAVIRACEVPCNDEAVAAVVAKAQRENRSVFSAFDLCRMLEEAGALQHVQENGEPFDVDACKPTRFVEDGVEYIQASEPPVSFWASTPEGLACAEADDPDQRFRMLLEGERVYLPLYAYLLKTCQRPTATSALSAVIDAHELTQSPRRYTQHFLKQLEDAGALVWDGAWNTTEAGSRGIAFLAECGEDGNLDTTGEEA